MSENLDRIAGQRVRYSKPGCAHRTGTVTGIEGWRVWVRLDGSAQTLPYLDRELEYQSVNENE